MLNGMPMHPSSFCNVTIIPSPIPFGLLYFSSLFTYSIQPLIHCYNYGCCFWLYKYNFCISSFPFRLRPCNQVLSGLIEICLDAAFIRVKIIPNRKPNKSYSRSCSCFQHLYNTKSTIRNQRNLVEQYVLSFLLMLSDSQRKRLMVRA